MKKIFNLLVSFVLIAGFSACSKDDSGNQQQEPEYPSPTPSRQRTTKVLRSFLPENPLSGLHKWGPRMKSHWNTALMNPSGSHMP